jgi:hypothetical protein
MLGFVLIKKKKLIPDDILQIDLITTQIHFRVRLWTEPRNVPSNL